MNGSTAIEADFESITDVFEEIDRILPADLSLVEWDELDSVTQQYAIQNLIKLRDAAASAILSLMAFLDLTRADGKRTDA